ncbi:MAG: hypothetical protein LCH36_04440 [Actinobacteria bacterium]|nr:hypothetical protein [Actinomycetota bacterium]
MSNRDTHKQNSSSALDHDSDPAHTPGNGWVDEGGASHLGPATHLDPELVAHEHEGQPAPTTSE